MRAFARLLLVLVLALGALFSSSSRADTVASLLGNFTINQFSGLLVTDDSLRVHYVVVFGQLPALRELHEADVDHNGVTSQEERDAYVSRLARSIGESLQARVDGIDVPLRASHWNSSLPTEQGGFSLRVDLYFSGSLAPISAAQTQSPASRTVEFFNHNYEGRMGWNEIELNSAAAISVFDTNGFSNSLTAGLRDALQSLPAGGPLNERSVHFRIAGAIPPGATPISVRAGTHATRSNEQAVDGGKKPLESLWITRKTRELIDSISAQRLAPRVVALALLGALLLGAVHALSPGHGKTIVGAYLIGSRGTARHAVFLGATVTVTHTVGVFVLGFATLYASRFIVPEKLLPILSLVSALLVLGMGAVLLLQRARAARPAPVFLAVESVANGNIRAAGTHSHGIGMHSHSGGPMHSHLPPGSAGEKVSWRSLLALGISGGLVPCPSAMVLLLAAVALNKTAFGMLLVVAFSVGLAITLTAVGLLFLYARNRLPPTRADARWPHLLPVLSAAAITALGVVLCFGALESFAS